MQCDCDLVKDYNRAITMLLSLRQHYKLHNEQNKADYVHCIRKSEEQSVWRGLGQDQAPANVDPSKYCPGSSCEKVACKNAKQNAQYSIDCKTACQECCYSAYTIEAVWLGPVLHEGAHKTSKHGQSCEAVPRGVARKGCRVYPTAHRKPIWLRGWPSIWQYSLGHIFVFDYNSFHRFVLG